jgi:phospholipase C
MRFVPAARPIVAALALAILLAGPAGAGAPLHRAPVATTPASLSTAVRPPFRAVTSPIQHVVFVIQENRSFNFMFNGYKGARTQNWGYNSQHQKITLHTQTLATSWEIDHSLAGYLTECDGTGSLPGTNCKMDGWDKVQVCCNQPQDAAYSYAIRSEVQPYWTMASQYVLADHLFQSNLDGSFVAHQFAIAAYASQTVNYPGGAWGCPGGKNDMVPTITAERAIGPNVVTCFDNPTIGSEADAAGLTWRFYTGTPAGNGGIWSAYQAIEPIYKGKDWRTDVVPTQSQFLSDVAKGKLANITWITPTWANSDHDGMNAGGGPAWVSSIVDAVGQSKFWDSTAIFVMWDDWGGYFDPVKPVTEDYDGLGFRVPLIIISPYAKRRAVLHHQFETTSVLKFIEDNFGLSSLAASDARAADPAAEAFNYAQHPRPFTNIEGARSYQFWHQLEMEQAGAPRRALAGGD